MTDKLLPPFRQTPRRLGPLPALAAPPAQPQLQIGVAAAQTALGEEDGDLGRGAAPAARLGLDQHVREARREGQGGDRLAVGGGAAVGGEGAEREEALPRLVDRGGRRRIEPGELARVGHAPQGAVEKQGGEIGLENLGRIEARQSGGRGFFPEAVDGSGALAAGAAGALGDGGLAGALGDQAGDAGGAVVAGAAGEAGIDDDADAVEGETGLGDGRGQHDFAPAGRRRGDGGTLRRGLEAAVEAVEVGACGERRLQPLGGALDLGDAGEKGEQAALRLGKGAADGGGHVVLDAPFGRAAEMDQRDGVGAAFAADHRRAAHQVGEALAVEGGGHSEEAEVRPERGLCIEGEGEAEVAVEAALVDLVEQDGGHAGELGVGLDAVPEDAFGEHGDPGAGGAPGVEAGGVADRAADGLAGELRHPLRGGPGGEAPGGEEQDLALAPRFGEEGGRDGGGLAGARRGDEHGVWRLAQCGEQVREDRVDRECIRHASEGWHPYRLRAP